MSGDNTLYAMQDGIATLTINRPDKLNALNHDTMGEIAAAVQRVAADDTVCALVVTGSGEKAFVAGADIGELATQTPVGGRQTSLEGQQVFDAMAGLDKPVIAAINGFALGGGLELALACHLRVASTNALLGLPEVSLGIIPGYGGTQRLARLIGPGRALEMILTARKIKADEAERLGLVNRVVPPGEAVNAATALAGEIRANGPLAVGYALQAVRRGLQMSLAEGQHLEATLFGLLSASDDMREGLNAFLEKRRPAFTGR
ncbi:MAG: enoyl-CoA hydratase/isomerase family protein [Acidobacteriota bacterium]